MQTKLTIVITMAGIGNRFRKVGYTVPKYQIEAHGRPLFDWSMLSLQGYASLSPNYIFIVRAQDKASAFIKVRCSMLKITEFKMIEIDELTDGQATTAMLAAATWNSGLPVLIYNIDTYVEPGEMNAQQLCGDGFIPCFNGEGDHWSFVKTDAFGKAIEVREKERISDHCTLGAYYFKTGLLYEQLYRRYYFDEKRMEKGEKYIAPLYNELITSGGTVCISDVPVQTVHVLGTPEELELFLRESIE